jgi:hypothetical protein
MKPITPKDIQDINDGIPDFVIDIMNAIIKEKFSRNGFTIYYGELQTPVMEYCKNNNIQYRSNWLDVENVYRKYGWYVHADSPGYNESYAGNWTFSIKKSD